MSGTAGDRPEPVIDIHELAAHETRRYHAAVDDLTATYRAAVRAVGAVVQGVSASARTLEAIRADLSEVNAAARAAGSPAEPPADVAEHITAQTHDPGLARLHRAAVTGPRGTAALLGELAAADPDPPAVRQDGPAPVSAARASVALLAWQHHQPRDVDPRELMAGADRTEVALTLAAMALHLAETAGLDVAEWLVDTGAGIAMEAD